MQDLWPKIVQYVAHLLPTFEYRVLAILVIFVLWLSINFVIFLFRRLSKRKVEEKNDLSTPKPSLKKILLAKFLMISSVILFNVVFLSALALVTSLTFFNRPFIISSDPANSSKMTNAEQE